MDQEKVNHNIVEFCTSFKKENKTIVDSVVKNAYEKMYESSLEIKDLSTLLALLERHEILDKPKCVNSQPGFYQSMHKKFKNLNGK